MQRYRCFFMARATRLLVLLAVACLVAAVHSSSAAAVPGQDADRVPERPFSITTLNVTDTTWTASWKVGAVASPAESYMLACVKRGDGCFAAARAVKTSIPRDAGIGSLTGVTAGSRLTCYVIAVNYFARVCSQGMDVEFGGAPGTPTDLTTVSVAHTSWTGTWKAGSALVPAETYSLTCVSLGQGCNSAPLGQSLSVTRERDVATATGLTPGSNVTCYVIAKSGFDSFCSKGVNVSIPVLPGIPTDVTTVNITTDSWTATWIESSPFAPVEKYVLKCVARGQKCASTAFVGNSAVAIQRGVGTGTVTNLTPGANATCYVVASNGQFSRCSKEVDISVLAAPGAPSSFASSLSTANTWMATWVDGAPGVPVETYTLKCVDSGESCRADALAQARSIQRGRQTGTVTGLKPGKPYTCYVLSVNEISSRCSSGLSVSVEGPASQPTRVGATSSLDSWLPAFQVASTPGFPEETYTFKCVASGGACNDTAVAQLTGITRANALAKNFTVKVSPLQPATQYTCYVIAVNSIGSVCSSAVNITTWRAPGRATNLTTIGVDLGRDLSNVTVSWTDAAIAGVPEETYTLKCVRAYGMCTDSPLAQITNITRGVQRGTVSGLLTRGEFSCFVVADNAVNSSCSDVGVFASPGDPKPPVNVTTTAVGDTTWSASWSVGTTAGFPEETYALGCAMPGTACTGSGVASLSLYPRTAGNGTVSGLTPGRKYRCFVQVTNPVFTRCYNPVDIATFQRPGLPSNLVTSSINSTTWTASWSWAALPGVPRETYTLKCVDRGGSCSDPAVAQTPNITGGMRTGSGSVSGLTPGKQYTCYLTVTGYLTELCSLSIAAEVTTLPGRSLHTVLPCALRL
jgi:hypothetical protein